jgi:hypothetical protein
LRRLERPGLGEQGVLFVARVEPGDLLAGEPLGRGRGRLQSTRGRSGRDERPSSIARITAAARTV